MDLHVMHGIRVIRLAAREPSTTHLCEKAQPVSSPCSHLVTLQIETVDLSEAGDSEPTIEIKPS
eukprot:10027939-Alexandrium_andersonii.AAC.1